MCYYILMFMLIVPNKRKFFDILFTDFQIVTSKPINIIHLSRTNQYKRINHEKNQEELRIFSPFLLPPLT